jgi:hypothetical protein
MFKEKTVDNIGWLTSICPSKFPNILLMANEVEFISPFKKTGKPAQADEFWLKIAKVGNSSFYKTIKEDIFNNTKISELKEENLNTASIEYYGIATYVDLNEMKHYSIKCTFYVREILGMADTSFKFIVDHEFKVKVDLYDDWWKEENERETSRFELMEID